MFTKEHEIVFRPIFTPEERDRLFSRLDKRGYLWRSGDSLITHIELLDRMLPCDIHINTERKVIAYSKSTINGKLKLSHSSFGN